MSDPRPRTKFIAAVLISALLLCMAEGALRLLGFEPFVPVVTKVYSTPKNNLIPDAQYGLALNPGRFQVYLNDQLSYQATHLADGTRSTGAQAERSAEIHIYGCSLTYGMGIDDSLSYPALLQASLKNFSIKNFSVPGYGTVHSLLQLREQLKNGSQPELILLAYSSLHDARNQLSGIQQKYWSQTLDKTIHAELDEAKFPYARLKNENLEIKAKSIHDFSKPWSLSQYSVLIYRLEMSISNIQYGFVDKYEISEKVIREIQLLCAQYQIPMLLLGLDKSDSVKKLRNFARGQSLPFLDISIDLDDPQYNLKPHDAHPNARAHQYYAEKIREALAAHLSNSLSQLQR